MNSPSSPLLAGCFREIVYTFSGHLFFAVQPVCGDTLDRLHTVLTGNGFDSWEMFFKGTLTIELRLEQLDAILPELKGLFAIEATANAIVKVNGKQNGTPCSSVDPQGLFIRMNATNGDNLFTGTFLESTMKAVQPSGSASLDLYVMKRTDERVHLAYMKQLLTESVATTIYVLTNLQSWIRGINVKQISTILR